MSTEEWRVERTRVIPHGAKLVVDEREGEVSVIWVSDELSDAAVKAIVKGLDDLTRLSLPRGSRPPESCKSAP